MLSYCTGSMSGTTLVTSTEAQRSLQNSNFCQKYENPSFSAQKRLRRRFWPFLDVFGLLHGNFRVFCKIWSFVVISVPLGCDQSSCGHISGTTGQHRSIFSVETWNLASNGYLCKGPKRRLRRFWAFIEGFSYFWRNLEFCSNLWASVDVTWVVPDILPVQ